jgi:uncharacterized membrane protein YeiB
VATILKEGIEVVTVLREAVVDQAEEILTTETQKVAREITATRAIEKEAHQMAEVTTQAEDHQTTEMPTTILEVTGTMEIGTEALRPENIAPPALNHSKEASRTCIADARSQVTTTPNIKLTH